MATWVGIFLNNLDGNSVRELEVEADDEVTAIMLLDLYDYDETWQHYSFVNVQKKEVIDISGVNICLQKQLQKPVGVPLVDADIKSLVTTLLCVHCFNCFCLFNSPLYDGQFSKFNAIAEIPTFKTSGTYRAQRVPAMYKVGMDSGKFEERKFPITFRNK